MSVYYSIYELIALNIYGSMELTTFQELVCTEFSTALSMLAVCLPLIIVYVVMKLITKAGDRLL